MPTVQVLDAKGKQAGSLELKPDVFGVEISVPLLHQARCERKVDQRAQTRMIRRIRFEHTHAHQIGHRSGRVCALLGRAHIPSIFDKALIPQHDLRIFIACN